MWGIISSPKERKLPMIEFRFLVTCLSLWDSKTFLFKNIYLAVSGLHYSMQGPFFMEHALSSCGTWAPDRLEWGLRVCGTQA